MSTGAVFPAFEQAAKKAGKDPSKMEKMVEIQLYFSDKNSGIESIRRSGEAGFLAEHAFSEVDPRKIQSMSQTVDDQKIAANWCFVSSPDDILETIEKYSQAGATEIELVTHSFADRIEYVGQKVLPYLRWK